MAQKYFEIDAYWAALLQSVDTQLQSGNIEELIVIAEAEISDCSPDASDEELKEVTHFLVAAFLLWAKNRSTPKIELQELTTLSASLASVADNSIMLHECA